MSTNQFTGTTNVWLSDTRWKSIEELQALVANGEHDEAVQYLAMANSKMESSGWIKLGTATVTVTLFDPDVVVSKQIDALKQELQKVRAEAQMEENAILARISKLQAIEYTPE